MSLHVVPTHTGKIFYDTERKLEFLTVGDYGKGNNIKAEFLGFHTKINGVQHQKVDLAKKWVATISTQKGCPMKCDFCDVSKFGFHGNATLEDFCYQLNTLLDNEPTKETERFNLHFARMGEPTFNEDVLHFTCSKLDRLVLDKIKPKTIHPVVSTMLPKSNPKLFDFLYRWCTIKNIFRNGEAGLQFSINSTDDLQREKQFNGCSLDLRDIAYLSDMLPDPVGRKYTLNFAVTNGTILDAQYLDSLFDKRRFIVKITPIHYTKSASESNYDLSTSYEKYDVYEQFEQPLLELGWDVIVFVPSKEEDEDRITCGNALIADKERGYL